MCKGFIIGVAAAAALTAVGAYLFVVMGVMPANADADPSRWERWAAHKSLHATIAREAPKTSNPVAATEENLVAGIKLYAADCAVCHGTSDGTPSRIAQGLYQRAPQFARHGVEDDPDGETFWKIDHGIRLTGMPSFHRTLNSTRIWQLTLFLKHMDQLSPAAQKAWRGLPSAGA